MTIVCAKCAEEAEHSGVVPPNGWMRMSDGWICDKHHIDVGAMMKEMSEICAALEKNEMTLENSLLMYERGVLIQRRIQDVLSSAERRMIEIVKPDGSVEIAEIDLGKR